MLTAEAAFGQARISAVPIANKNGATIRDIALPLFVHSNAYWTNNYALSVGEMFGASIIGFAFCSSPILPLTGPFDSIPGQLIDELTARNESEARENAIQFEQQAKLRGQHTTTRIIRAGANDASQHFSELARNFDFSVLPQAKDGDYDYAEAAVFDAGRPAIVVPYIHEKTVSLSRVVVCWDGSRAAARAVGDAWPLLERASSVDIVTVGEPDRAAALQYGPGEHFARHGVTARLSALDGGDIDAGNIILSYAADVGASMIVMGAYGHSRMKEWILGGVTRTILKTMTVPVLMSH
jgi:nucleotide-binding universal stress UspA family protein